MRAPILLIMLMLASLASVSAPVAAQEREVPYWASIRAEVVNMRKGPSTAYPIKWVYRRPGLPVKVVRVMQGWRLVLEPDGTQGWIVGRLLTLERSAFVTGEEPAAMHAAPDPDAAISWRAEPGVVGKLGACENGWCELNVGGRRGWIEGSRIWGSGEP